MSKRATFTRFSSEYDGGREYYLDTGEEVPIKFSEEPYKPEYDTEIGNIKHWWFKHEVDLYLDVDTRLARFRTRTMIGAYLKLLRKVWLHKHIWRYI